jgi:hypothetical protein
MTGATPPSSEPEPTSAQRPGAGGQTGYPTPPTMGPETTRLARLDPGPSLAFGFVGSVIAAVGAALIVISFTVLDWFTKNSITIGSNAHTHFSDIHKVLDVVDNSQSISATGTAKLYFSWLGWALLVVVALFALLANLPSPLTMAYRIVGAIGAAAAIAVTFAAIKLVNSSPVTASYGDFLKHTSTGFYLAVGGFVLLGVGAMVGPAHRGA